jgi:hypothetical protein
VRQLSFCTGLKQVRENAAALSTADDDRGEALVDQMVRGAGSVKVGERPDRVEPRRVKRRPKDAKLLNKPRAQARKDVEAGCEADKPKTLRKRKPKAQSPAPPQA